MIAGLLSLRVIVVGVPLAALFAACASPPAPKPVLETEAQRRTWAAYESCRNKDTTNIWISQIEPDGRPTWAEGAQRGFPTPPNDPDNLVLERVARSIGEVPLANLVKCVREQRR